MSKLQVFMFGSPAIYWNDGRVVFPFAKMEAILYYLLVTGETTREKLASLFWGEMQDDVAKKNLRNTLYLLKKQLASELFITPTRTTISINPEALHFTDLEFFNQLAADLSLADCPGDFLEGFYCKDAPFFDEWVTLKREEFKEKLITFYSSKMTVFFSAKNYAAAKQSCKYLIRLDEYNENAYQILMCIYEHEEAYYRVLELYHILEMKMADELNLQPSSKTHEIYKRVNAKRIVAANIKATTQDSRKTNQFFFRNNEMNLLYTAIDAFMLNRQNKQMFLMEGEEGVGKTAIIEHFFMGISSLDLIILKTQCNQAKTNYAYKALSNIFTQIMNILKVNNITIPALWQSMISYIFPILADNSDNIHQQETLMQNPKFNLTMVEECLCGILGKLLMQRKVVLFVDDIQWMDKQSLAVLYQVLQMYKQRLLCIAACHSEYSAQIEKNMYSFERNEMIEKILVERFTKEETFEFTQYNISAKQLTSELEKQLYEHTGGNVLFLMECLHLIRSGKDITNGSFHIQNILKERIGNLTHNGKKILEIAAVFSRSFTYNALLNISNINELQLAEAIEELEHKNLISPTEQANKGLLAYDFCNLQIRNFVYQQLSTVKRRLLHYLVGSALEKQLQSEPKPENLYDTLLYHYTQAGDKKKILEFAEKYLCPQYEKLTELIYYYPTGHINVQEEHRHGDYLEKIPELKRLAKELLQSNS